MNNRKSTVNAIIPLLICLIFFTCERKKVEQRHSQRFCINDTLFKSIKIDTVKTKQVENELRLTGKITFNEDQVIKIYPFAGGLIEELKVELGDFVKKGQVLALVRSSEIVDFENQFITAKSDLAVSQKNLQVAQDMYKGNLASEKDYIIAKNDVQKSESEYQRIKEVLKIYGVGEQGSTYNIKAPISGYIVEKNVTQGMQFRSDNTENLFTISNLDNLWAVANVYESDISKIKLNQKVIVNTLAYQDIHVGGQIDKIFNVLDAESRVEKVKIKLQNIDNLLKPEMFAYVTVFIPEDQKLPCITSNAVIFDNSKNYTLVFTDKCTIEIREVKLYKNIKGHTFISNGLKDGEKVISENQLLVYNALTNK